MELNDHTPWPLYVLEQSPSTPIFASIGRGDCWTWKLLTKGKSHRDTRQRNPTC